MANEVPVLNKTLGPMFTVDVAPFQSDASLPMEAMYTMEVGVRGVQLNPTGGYVRRSGVGDPSPALGNNNDLYFDTESYNFWQKFSTTWTLIGNLQGPQGIQGPGGNNLLVGTDSLDPLDYPEGTVFLNPVNGDLFEQEGGSWVLKGNIMGPAGSTGADGPQGPAGADGIDGVDGVDGKTVLYGAADPTSEGNNGDFYINTTSKTIFGPKAAGVWPSGTSLIGPAGTDGTDGIDGSNGLNADMTRSSTTSNTIGTGSKTFGYASSSNLGWTIGTRIRAANSSTNYMEGEITAVSETSVTFTSDFTSGSGTFTAWTLSIAGERGAAGADGSAGAITAAADVPSDASGANGDYYINTTTGAIYKKAAGTWGSAVGNMLSNASETLQNKTLDNTNTVTLKDTMFTLQDNGNATKQMRFQLSGITAGQTRVLTPPDANTVLYGRSNLVGTVSQSSGVPTGAAFERDSNGNGRWWKAAEGHMQCSRDNFLVGPITTVDVAGYTSGTFTWTFPQPFAAVPSVNGVVSDGRSSVHILSRTKTSVTFRVRSPEATNFLLIGLEAKGRWFSSGVTDPADLFLSGEKGVWYDFSNPATLFSDTARTTLLTASGQQVAGIADLSGNGVHLNQATSTKRPTFTVGSDGRSYLSFDGVDDCMASVINLDLAASQVTILAAFRKSVDVTTAVMLELSDNVSLNNGAFTLFAPSNVGGNYDNINIYSRGATTTVSRPVQGIAAPITCVAVCSSDTVSGRISNRVNKGTELTTLTTQGGGNFGAYLLRVGARGAGGTLPFGGWIAEIIIRAGILSEADITSLTEYLYAKAGV